VRRLFVIVLVFSAVGRACLAQTTGELAPPVHVMAGDGPVDTQRVGHAAPFFGDFDGDGLGDLLVGEFFEGRLRVFPNVGTAAEPRFDDYAWFKAGTDLGRVPTG
jgi:hypothetical protein